MLKTTDLRTYSKERFTWTYVVGISAFIYYLSTAQPHFDATMLVLLILGMLFFRIFDDFFCLRFDQVQGKQRESIHLPRNFYIILQLTLGGLFLVTTLTLAGEQAFWLSISFVLAHLPFYFIFRQSKLILYVSMLKYIFMVYLIGFYFGGVDWMGAALAVSFFILREIFEEEFHFRNKKLEITFAIGLVLAKAIGDYV